ncbi:MAG: dihydroorotate dehydrogenase-like protein [Deltaproteobacteria bacterium]|nr:dihydroorotate dehydrogenase-like protein [Deltaproteobacteria bacterium]
MPALETCYLGLKLKNPLIVGSSGLTKTVEGVRRCAAAGAGAVVLKSLFEEEIRLEYQSISEALGGYPHPEALDWLQTDLAAHYGADSYLKLIEESVASVSIPVIASLNCVTPETWVKYASRIEGAGAAAIELNVYRLPLDPAVPSEQIEQSYIETVKAVRAQVSIPVSLKMIPYLTNIPRFSVQAHEGGARGLVLFNRFFHPDLDIVGLEPRGGLLLSRPEEYRLPLRWIGILYGRTGCDLCASTGVHEPGSVIRLLLAGAKAVQVTSAIYLYKHEVLGKMLHGLEEWMDEHGFESIASFRGKVSRFHSGRPEMFERSQYIKAFVDAE